MSLLELMLEENVEWPVVAEFAVQDYSGKIRFAIGAPVCNAKYYQWEGCLAGHGFDCGKKLEKWDETIITREEYQAAGGWMKWEGGERPVPKEAPIMYSTKAVTAEPAKAGACRWEHVGNSSDILAYRLTAIIPGCNLERQPAQDNSWRELGGLPLVGVPVELWVGGSFAYNCEFITRRGHHYVMWNLDADRPDAADYMNSEFRPLRTEREKAIDEMIGILKAKFDRSDVDGIMVADIVDELYDAGYRKVKQ